jgi:hypothetical protein
LSLLVAGCDNGKDEDNEITALNKQISSLKKEVAALTSQNEKQVGEIGVRDERISDLRNQLTELRGTTTNDLEALRAALTKAQSDLTTAQESLGECSTELKDRTTPDAERFVGVWLMSSGETGQRMRIEEGTSGCLAFVLEDLDGSGAGVFIGSGVAVAAPDDWMVASIASETRVYRRSGSTLAEAFRFTDGHCQTPSSGVFSRDFPVSLRITAPGYVLQECGELQVAAVVKDQDGQACEMSPEITWQVQTGSELAHFRPASGTGLSLVGVKAGRVVVRVSCALPLPLRGELSATERFQVVPGPCSLEIVRPDHVYLGEEGLFQVQGRDAGGHIATITGSAFWSITGGNAELLGNRTALLVRLRPTTRGPISLQVVVGSLQATANVTAEGFPFQLVAYNKNGPVDGEWIDIKNVSTTDEDLLGWKIGDGEDEYEFKNPEVVRADQTRRVLGTEYNESGYTGYLYLDDHNDHIELLDSHGVLMDCRGWGDERDPAKGCRP